MERDHCVLFQTATTSNKGKNIKTSCSGGDWVVSGREDAAAMGPEQHRGQRCTEGEGGVKPSKGLKALEEPQLVAPAAKAQGWQWRCTRGRVAGRLARLQGPALSSNSSTRRGKYNTEHCSVCHKLTIL